MTTVCSLFLTLPDPVVSGEGVLDPLGAAEPIQGDLPHRSGEGELTT